MYLPPYEKDIKYDPVIACAMKVLVEWAAEAHGPGCAAILCRHARAKIALSELDNVLKELLRLRS